MVKQTSGPGCSKLTTSLVNVSLNFRKLVSQICQYSLLKKCEKLLQCKMQKLLSFFSTKTFSVFGYKVVKHLTSLELRDTTENMQLENTSQLV